MVPRKPDLQMELGARLHVPTPVSLREGPLYPLLRSGGSQTGLKRWLGKKRLPLPRMEPMPSTPCLVTIDHGLI